MKFIRLLVVITLITGGISSCESGTKERDLLFKEVMRIHDEVMPKMADINRTNRGLRDLMTQDSTISDSLKTIINTRVVELSKAEEAMNNWMRDFESPKSSDPDEQVIDYLKKEEIKISGVSEMMLETLESGNQLLTDLKKQ